MIYQWIRSYFIKFHKIPFYFKGILNNAIIE